jgi:hypothetical protein
MFFVMLFCLKMRPLYLKPEFSLPHDLQIDSGNENNRPKCSPSIFWVKINRCVTFLWKNQNKIWTAKKFFKKIGQIKQSPKRRKFAQSGHPVPCHVKLGDTRMAVTDSSWHVAIWKEHLWMYVLFRSVHMYVP